MFILFSKYDCAKFPIWIISDARRSSDLKYFRSVSVGEDRELEPYDGRGRGEV